jgi:hypothetical protein
MDIEVTTAVIREVGRRASDVAGRSRQNVYNDAAYEAADAIGARPAHSTEMIPVAPVGGPEYTGRA